MKSLSFGLLISLMVLSFNLFGQASWNYSIWFKLYDKSGSRVNLATYKKDNIKLYSAGHGAHMNNKLEYDLSADMFKFSQHTIIDRNVLLFVKDQDSIVIDVSTRSLYFKDISLIPGYYNISVWGRPDKFNYDEYLPWDSKMRLPTNADQFESYKINKKDNRMMTKLVEVKLD